MRLLARTATTLATLLAVGASALTTGCGSDATSPQDQFPGTYTLRTVNGQSLPVVYNQDASGTTYVTSDVYTFNSDGTLSELAALRFTPASGGTATTQSATYTGTWTLSGTSVTAQLSDNTSFTGTFSGGNTITVNDGGVTLVLQK